MEWMETRDEAIRTMRNAFERILPGQYRVTHDGDRILVMRGDEVCKVDPIGPLMLRDPRNLYAAIIRRLGTSG